jgi:hypothetical protein
MPPTPNMPASTQRPFFSNFLAAFRTTSFTGISQPTASKPSSHSHAHSHSHSHSHTHTQSTHTSSATTASTSPSSASQPRQIHSNSSKQQTASTTSPLNSLQSPRTPGASPSPGSSPRYNNAFRSASDRRGSDSSSEGFREIIGREKWYIGGRTQGGEEKYFRLGVVRRRRSGGEMSLDRLSL